MLKIVQTPTVVIANSNDGQRHPKSMLSSCYYGSRDSALSNDRHSRTSISGRSLKNRKTVLVGTCNASSSIGSMRRIVVISERRHSPGAFHPNSSVVFDSPTRGWKPLTGWLPGLLCFRTPSSAFHQPIVHSPIHHKSGTFSAHFSVITNFIIITRTDPCRLVIYIPKSVAAVPFTNHHPLFLQQQISISRHLWSLTSCGASGRFFEIK